MDIKELYTAEGHNEGSEMQIKDQYGEPVEMYIRLAGIDSDIYRTSMRKQRIRMITDGKEARENTDYDLDLLVDASIDWRGFEDEGKELKFTKKRVHDLYIQAPYIRDQVQNYIEKRVNFMKR